VQLEPGVLFHEIPFADPGPNVPPGRSGKLWLYLPEGDHATHSLACVLNTAAGTTLITGAHLTEAGRAEHLPYVRAGFAVLAFEMDGAIERELAQNRPAFRKAVQAFAAAQGGLANARTALEFLDAKVPQVDPNRIAVAGHSSAGTEALLVAASEPRIKACVAYAPRADIESNFDQAQKEGLLKLVPEVNELFTQFNPIHQLDRVHCPVFLFHAQDDSVVPVALSRELAEKLENNGGNVTFVTVPFGEHYRSMLDHGIRRAIDWLQQISL
jgi:dienelactone hydrolase